MRNGTLNVINTMLACLSMSILHQKQKGACMIWIVEMKNVFKVPNFVTLLSLCDEKFVTKIVHLASWFGIIYRNLITSLVNNIVAYWCYCHIIVCTTIFVLCVKSEKVCTIIIYNTYSCKSEKYAQTY